MELVRHRLGAYSQESTRYVDYSDDVKTAGHCQFIIPVWSKLPTGCYTYDPVMKMLTDKDTSNATDISDPGDQAWLSAMQHAEDHYLYLRSAKCNWAPQQAREVLPNSTKTEIYTTFNFRQWKHVFRMRTSNKAHPEIQRIMKPTLLEFQANIPGLFDDIKVD